MNDGRFMKDKKALIEIEEGDEVYYYNPLGTTRYSGKILKVTGVTKTLIICGRERFRNHSGTRVGFTSTCKNEIAVLTPDLRTGIKRYTILTKISEFNFQVLALEDLKKIDKIIKERINLGGSNNK
jgi:hypothetical protein